MTWTPQVPIVVPVDFSDGSERAVRTAQEIAPVPQDVHLVHMLFPLDSVSPGVMWGGMDDRKREQAVRQRFADFLAQLDVEGPRTASAWAIRGWRSPITPPRPTRG